jgi:hypothetical protein
MDGKQHKENEGKTEITVLCAKFSPRERGKARGKAQALTREETQ